MERYAGKPFAVIGVNSDGNAEEAKPLLKKFGITWRQAIDERTSGPIATEWNVRGWPTTYLLDTNGAILDKRALIMTDELDDLVERAGRLKK